MCAMTISRNHPSLTYSDQTGEHVFGLDRDSITIGRLSDQDLVLPDAFVSRRHALIRLVDGNYELFYQASSHGTYLNGKRI